MANLPDKPQIGDTGHVPDTSMIIDAIADLDARKVETLAIGTVTTDAPGSQATATIVGGPGGTHTLSLSIPAGAPGAKGDPGERGPGGPEGKGVPTGGLAGQVLTKRSGFDHDAEWVTSDATGTISHGGLTDLNRDDHPQYLTYARGDEQYATKTALDGWVGALTDLALASGPDAVAGHVAEADPHAQYLRKAANETMTGSLTVQKASAQVTVEATSGNAAVLNRSAAAAAYYYAEAPAGQYAGLLIRDAATSKNRWLLAKANTAEPGSNAGSDLVLLRYDDAGNYITGGALTVSRATGLITVNGDPVLPNHIANKNYVDTTRVAKSGDTMTGNLAVEKASATIEAKSTSGEGIVMSSAAGAAAAARLVASSATGAALADLRSVAGQSAVIYFRGGADGLKLRWTVSKHTGAESGSNSGADLQIVAHDDAGAGLHNVLTASRATGLITVKGDPTAALGVATKQYVDNVGKWQAYTPTLTGTGFTLGASTLTGRYTRIGNTVHFTAQCTLGAGFVMGTSYLVMGLPPVTCSSAFSRYMASATFLKTGAGANNYWGGAYVNASGCQIVPISLTSLANTNFSPTVPFTWAAGDSISVAGTYEAA